MGTDSAWIVTAQGGITCFVKKATTENPMAVWGVHRGDTRRASLHAYEPCT
ncbi:MAG: hypothetical protein LUF04_15015 [Bacteroides sp.]|nr:hypothetical protein [Bacteroides sp.]